MPNCRAYTAVIPLQAALQRHFKNRNKQTKINKGAKKSEQAIESYV